MKASNTQNTRNYNKFKLGANQPVTRLDATSTLVESVRLSNGNSLSPGLVHKETMEIVDGHRRYSACKRANVPFYYVYVTGSIKEIKELNKRLNTSGKQWSLKDYLNSYAMTSAEYKELLVFTLKWKTFPMECLKSFCALTSKDIKAEVKLDIDYELLEEQVNCMFVVKGYYPNISLNDIHRALWYMYKIEGFEPDKLIHKLELLFSKGKLKTSQSHKYYFLNTLSDAYDAYSAGGDHKLNIYSKLQIGGLLH